MLLDASVWLAAVDQDDSLYEAARCLVRADNVQHAALDLTVYEVANVAARSWNDPARAERLARLVLVACEDRLIRVDAELTANAITLAAEESITVYDAAYVAAARRGGLTLVSGDIADLVRPGFAVSPDAAEE